jgi:Transposase DDE domain
MEHQLWKAIVEWLERCGKPRRPRYTYSDVEILKVFFWSVLHDRPVSWACDRANWPLQERRWAKPSQSRVSRRLSSASVRQLLERLEQELLRPHHRCTLVWILDGKPLTIGGCSKDRQAGYGRAAGGKARGYKIHVIYGSDGSIAAWRIAPMNVDERVMAARMLRVAPVQGYVLADSNYDSNPLHRICDQRGNIQLVTPRRYGPGRGHGHRKQTPGRLRSKDLLENPQPLFGQQLFAQRPDIERNFGNLTNWGGGLTHLPAWVRTHHRVHRWVQAKLILRRLKSQTPSSTCAA